MFRSSKYIANYNLVILNFSRIIPNINLPVCIIAELNELENSMIGLALEGSWLEVVAVLNEKLISITGTKIMLFNIVSWIVKNLYLTHLSVH